MSGERTTPEREGREHDLYLDRLEEVAIAAQALLESGGWRYNNQMPPDPTDPRVNYFGVEGRFARRLSDALVGVSRIPRADHYEDWG